MHELVEEIQSTVEFIEAEKQHLKGQISHMRRSGVSTFDVILRVLHQC